mgnify:CR=1 FL=1
MQVASLQVTSMTLRDIRQSVHRMAVPFDDNRIVQMMARLHDDFKQAVMPCCRLAGALKTARLLASPP